MQCRAAQPHIGLDDRRLQILRQLGGENGLPHLAAALAEVLHVVRVEVAQNLADALVEPRLAQKMAVRLGRDGETIGHLDALARQFAAHLAQRGILAADQRDVVDADLVKPEDVFRTASRRLPRPVLQGFALS